ncbi:plasmid mobilization relaxosome protein MobC [Streptantibioticus ferralitis]|uniref:Plasmid mobilization relaxosome protein MobC n=1 Tax=Streptantibioticus ferralitis TaxID=236510 RepID=A0ABT5Z0H9_9ACTN|nr:plasmid mobilization relaxosome protein MobC [Streptantibioticus ferralitis]MDF2257329.1 plasmid mobilization relaxosome protein MobC [Streptantibioticus ferralitis]
MSPNPFSRKARRTHSGSTRQAAAPHRHDTTESTPVNSGASWGEVRIAEGDADFALGSAPVEADQVRAQRGTDHKAVEAERDLHQDKDQPTVDHSDPSEPAEDVARFESTITADAFVHHGIAAYDVPAPAEDDTSPGSARRRRLSEVLYRPRSGIKRDVQLTCSAEPAERDFIDRAAREAKRSRSAFLMDAALTFAHAYLPDQRPAAVPALPSPQATQELMVLAGRLLREFHRIGSNLNQIVRAIHSGDLPDRAEQVLDELHQVARLTRRTLEQVLAGGGRRGA